MLVKYFNLSMIFIFVILIIENKAPELEDSDLKKEKDKVETLVATTHDQAVIMNKLTKVNYAYLIIRLIIVMHVIFKSNTIYILNISLNIVVI